MQILHLLFYIFFYSNLSYFELYRILDIICFSILKNKENTQINREKLAKKISSLGIIIVKLSQWLSIWLKIKFEDHTNLDLLLDTLPLLQCDCQQEKNPNLKEYISRYDNILDSVETEIFKSASVGQIYKGCLKTGEDIVLKIKNPNIEDDILKWEIFFHSFLQYIKLNVNMDNFFKNLREQIDFEQEANNLKLFKRKHRKNKLVKIPQLFDFDKDVIIMEYVKGESFLDVKHELSESDREYYIMLSKLFYQQSVFLDDIVHMDLHANNWAIDRQSQSLVIYDFGWVLKENIDFKKFFLLCHIDSKETLNFFLKKYDLENNEKITTYVHELVSNKEVDVLSGLKIIIKLFPQKLAMDDFLFSVLSITIFINSLMEKLDTDLDSYILKEIEFINKHGAFIQLGTLLTYSKENQTKSFLKKWYDEIYNETTLS